MNIIICGAGEVGSHAAETLAGAGHTITVIDLEMERLRIIEDTMDVRTLEGNAADAAILREAGADEADLVLAATDQDEVNLLTASVAKGVGAKKTIARVHHIAYFEAASLDYQAHFNIDRLICPEYSTAIAIARHLRNPAALVVENFARGRIDMQEFPVSDDAPAIGKTLPELKLGKGWRLAAVTRQHKVFIPDVSTTLQKGDRVVLVANASIFSEIRRAFHRDDSTKRKVVIMGGPPMAVWLCRALRQRNWSIRLFEKERDRALDLAEKLDWVTVLNADPTDRAVFDEEQIGQADVFIALLNDDEANIIGCVLAKSMGVTTCMAVVQRSTYVDLLYHIGVDRPFSPRMVAVKEIENVLDESPLRKSASLADGEIDAYRVRIVDDSPVVGKTLAQIKLAPDWTMVAIRRGDEVWVPGAEDVVKPGDIALVTGRNGAEATLRRIFRPK